jgi:hypothetical protein
MPRKPASSERPQHRRGKPPVDGSLPSGASGFSRYKFIAIIALLVVVVMAAGWNWFPEAPAGQVVATTAKNDRFLAMPVAAGAQPAAAALPKDAQRQLLVAQLEQADQVLCNYVESTRYPNSSRPMSEHPDQIYPNQPVAESHPMRKKGGGTDKEIQIQTTQSRVYLAAGEAAIFTIKATDTSGKPLALSVDKAIARGLVYAGARETSPVPVPMSDSGREGDAIAGDGIYSGMLAPVQTGFASFNGTIRTELNYVVNGQTGFVFFDVIYSSETPAVWSGNIRESTEGGSLKFILKANVNTPGRYIVNGRVDDAKGKPFALVTFNDLLPQGGNDIPLTVVGNLLRDRQPAMPLTLRDVDAYLLKENTDPDRALMPRLEGSAYVSKTYPLKTFSDAEWSSEERSRYITEFSKDVALAKSALLQFDPEQERKPLPQSECSRNKKPKN